MFSLAIKMLIGNRASFLGVIFGIFLATLLISQQSAIFLGLISRSYRTITDIPAPNIWVMDRATEGDDRVRGMREDIVDIVASTQGIKWAVPLDVLYIPIVSKSSVFQIAQMYGIDGATLIGAPLHMLEGDVQHLRQEGAIIVDLYSARGALASIEKDGTKKPLQVGDEMEINNHRATVVGICKITQGFYPQPIIFTTHESFRQFTSNASSLISFVIAESYHNVNVEEVCHEIEERSKMEALSKEAFQSKIVTSFLRTGILINFGLSVGLGFIVGFSIAGQIFYIMTLDNLSYYALIRAVGASRKMIITIIMTQTLVSGFIGFFLGIGATLMWGMAIRSTTLAFLFPWWLLGFTSVMILVICLLSAMICIKKVLKTDPKSLLGS